MDIQLFYREYGSGEPMILLHGNGSSGAYFKHQIPAFSEQYRMILPDTRGHGNSPRGTAEFTIRQFAEDLNTFLIRLGLEKIILLGFSDGANIAMQFAVRYQEKLRLLILDGGNLDPTGVKRRHQAPIEAEYSAMQLIAEPTEEERKRIGLLELQVHDPNISPAELKTVTVPTLVMAGTEDIIKTSHTKRIASLLPNAELTILNGGHCVAREEPTAFNTAVQQFLDRHKA